MLGKQELQTVEGCDQWCKKPEVVLPSLLFVFTQRCERLKQLLIAYITKEIYQSHVRAYLTCLKTQILNVLNQEFNMAAAKPEVVITLAFFQIVLIPCIWDCSSIYNAIKVISTSGFGAAILNFT